MSFVVIVMARLIIVQILYNDNFFFFLNYMYHL